VTYFRGESPGLVTACDRKFKGYKLVKNSGTYFLDSPKVNRDLTSAEYMNYNRKLSITTGKLNFYGYMNDTNKKYV